MNNKTVAIGLSGGVDSSVAAYILKKNGYRVIGITMKVCDSSKYPQAKRSACFGGGEDDDIDEAKSVASKLDIPFHLIDLSDEYERIVIEYFKSEYLEGRTPNPCIRCNAMVKFGLLPDMAIRSGIAFDYFATGHYARVSFDELSGFYQLRKAACSDKDQSYFLSRLTQKQLSGVLFPLGELSKYEVRDIARSIGLPNADREESQDFYGGEIGDLFKGTSSAGKIKTLDGKILGEHNGLYNFTIGKRRGIGQKTGDKLYVVGIDSGTNTVIAGDELDLFSDTFIASNMHWIESPCMKTPFRCTVKIRHRHEGREAVVTPLDGGKVNVKLFVQEKAVTPGQFAVLYDGDRVIGSGCIQK